MATVRIIGRIGADAEKKLAKTGKEYVTFRMAENIKDREGNPQTLWYSVTTNNHVVLTPYLTKGKLICVDGRLNCRTYQTKDGKTEIGYDVLAYNIEMITVGNGENNGTAKAEAAPTTQTTMAKPTTAEIKVPTETATDDADDELPF